MPHPLLATVKALLWHGESNVLDYKEEQYPLVKSTDGQKGELVKDIYAMANSWGEADTRYILTGVRENPGGKAVLVGVTEHLPDHALQQLVNSQASRVVDFQYHAVEVEGKQLGVIQIPRQARPTYRKKKLGGLMKGDVWVRRGSSSTIAEPSEIAEMGAADSRGGRLTRSAELVVQLGDPENRQLFGSEGDLTATVDPVIVPSNIRIPDWKPERYDISMVGLYNRDYYRQFGYWYWASRGIPFCLFIQNSGRGTALNVKLRVAVNPGEKVALLTELPAIPSKTSPSFAGPPDRRPMRPERVDGPGLVVEYEVGTMQPGMSHWTHPFYVIPAGIDDLSIEITSFADHLSESRASVFSVSVEGRVVRLSVEDLLGLAS